MEDSQESPHLGLAPAAYPSSQEVVANVEEAAEPAGVVAAVLAGVEAELVGVMAAAVEGRQRRRPLMCRMPLPLRLPSPLLIWRWVPNQIWGRSVSPGAPAATE